MERYTHTDCCCFNCGGLVDETSNPDCACDGGPVYHKSVCAACPKGSFCDVPKNPKDYLHDDDCDCSKCTADRVPTIDFGGAVVALKQGHCVRRKGWNGKGMHVYLEDHFHCLVGKGGGLEHTRSYGPCLVLFTAQANHQPGWNASTADVLAEDWQIVEP